MGKRAQSRISRHERDQAGCMRGLISIFDFRHSPSRTTKRFLTDGSHVGKNTAGAERSSIKAVSPDPILQYVDDDEGSNTSLVDCGKTSVKELMEEEMSSEQGPTHQSNDAEIESEQVDKKGGQHTKKNSKRKSRICNKSSDMDSVELETLKCEFLKVLGQNNLDLKTIIDELSGNNLRSTNFLKHAQDDMFVQEKMVAAVKLLIENGVDNSKHLGDEGKSQYSKELVVALQTLSSDKALLFKLMQDPNPVLAKGVQDLKDSQIKEELAPSTLPESSLLEKKPKSGEVSGRKHHNLFRRRSKSLEGLPVGRDTDSHSSNKIVILKPGSPDIDAAMNRRSFQSKLVNNMTSNPRNTSQFSFTEIKRRLRHAMGKERNVISHEGLVVVSPKNRNGNNGDKSATGEALSWSSPNRNHFYTERFSKSLASSKNGSTMMNGNSRPGPGVSNIYIEAKKHLSEILNIEETTAPVSAKVPKPLGRILSYPDYNSSPCFSPREHGDDTFITAQMRLSPRGMVRDNIIGLSHDSHNNLPTPSRRSLESQPRISNDEVQAPVATVSTSLANDQGCSTTEDSITHQEENLPSEEVEIEEKIEEKIVDEKLEARPQEEETSISFSSGLCSKSAGVDTLDGEIRKVDMEKEGSQCSEDDLKCYKTDLLQEEHMSSPQTISPSRSPSSEEVKDSNCAIDHVERPSPVSVLDLVYTEDDISPASTISRPVAKEIQPRHIHFEEQYRADDEGTCVRISLEDEESAFEYVEAVLLGSGLNWDEFLLRWLSLQEILDSSLFDEVELFSSRSHHDQKILFDCANNALYEVCEIHFRCFTGTSHIMNICPVPKGMDLINEVWKRVEWLLLQLPQRHSLDQLVKKDLAEFVKWMNLKPECELIGSEMGDIIFDELVEDTMMSFFDDASAGELAMPPAECYSDEDACQLVDSDGLV